jgi:hypothetical protein
MPRQSFLVRLRSNSSSEVRLAGGVRGNYCRNLRIIEEGRYRRVYSADAYDDTLLARPSLGASRIQASAYRFFTVAVQSRWYYYLFFSNTKGATT